MTRRTPDLAEFSVTLYEKTPRALFVGREDVDDYETAQWIPRSLVEGQHPSLPGEIGSILIPEWKARELGWD